MNDSGERWLWARPWRRGLFNFRVLRVQAAAWSRLKGTSASVFAKILSWKRERREAVGNEEGVSVGSRRASRMHPTLFRELAPSRIIVAHRGNRRDLGLLGNTSNGYPVLWNCANRFNAFANDGSLNQCFSTCGSWFLKRSGEQIWKDYYLYRKLYWKVWKYNEWKKFVKIVKYFRDSRYSIFSLKLF